MQAIAVCHEDWKASERRRLPEAVPECDQAKTSHTGISMAKRTRRSTQDTTVHRTNVDRGYILSCSCNSVPLGLLLEKGPAFLPILL
eukprot:5722806-Amphidinium_carterae.1